MALPQTTTQGQLSSTTPTGLSPNFKLVDDLIKHRMVMSIEGDWGTGKTDLALTAPGPIAFFKFDLNTEFTLKRHVKLHKKIYQVEYDIPDANAPNAQVLAEKLMETFVRDYQIAIRNPEIRTVVWDTATEIWEQVRLAAFGKLTNVMPHHYVQVNNGFRSLIKMAFDSDTNLIMIHRLKDEWQNYTDDKGKEKGKKTGRKERAGFSDIGFACQVMVQTFFTPDNTDSPFQMKVLKCTQNPIITHQIYSQVGDMRMNSFPYLAADVFPGTDVDKDWT